MRRITNKTLLWSVFIITFALIITTCDGKRPETVYIISTNDIHSTIDAFPKLATVVGEYRAQDTATVILVDAGDRWTGNPYVDAAPEPGQPIIELMSLLGYDVATFGNHEFDNGAAILEQRTKEATFPVVLANIDAGTSGLSQPRPYLILQARGGQRIAFTGFITNFVNGHPDGPDWKFENMSFPSIYETAAEYEWLDKKSDAMVAITHIGADVDSILAVNVPIFDLIIGGHTHTVLEEPKVYGKTYVTQTGNKLSNVGVTKLVFKGKKLKSIENQLINLDSVAPDPVYAAIVEKYYDNEEFKKVVGSFSADMTKTGMANFFTDVTRQDMNADFAFYHIGGVRLNGLPAGNVTYGDILMAEPFGSYMVKVEMTLPQIREMIINKFNDTENVRESHRIDLYPSGTNYTVVTDEKGDAVDVTFDHKYPYEAGRIYTVAMSNYIFDNYKFEKPASLDTSRSLKDVFREYLGKHSPVKPDNDIRATIRQR